MRNYLFTPLLFLATASFAAATPERFFEDASLRAVQFVDAKEGWAVGDEGVIWHTIDAGQTWERQPTGIRASLRSIHFLNPYVGWAVGREELPHGNGSVGVVLFTEDGGEKWNRILVNALPGLNQVRFLNPKVGFLLSDGNDQFPSGLFQTNDGGQRWEPVKGPRTPGWLSGEFSDAKNGILVGPWSRLVTLRDSSFGSADFDTLGGRSLRGLKVMPQRLVAVGDGGLILTSISNGARWGFGDLKLPPEILACLDFHAISAVGTKTWVCGRPGSVIFASEDSGGTWKMQSTGQPLSLHSIFFLDENRGWAVGDAGTIVATTDGGKKWSTLKQGGKRSAALMVHAQAENLPLDTIASLGAEEGYLVQSLRVVSPDSNSALFSRAFDSERLASASRLAGGLGGEMLWHFPLPQHLAGADKKELLNHWNQMHGERADRELLRQLVLTLRIWRPTTVVGDSAEGNSLGALIAEALPEACKLAQDPQAFPEQLDKLGLKTWGVKRLVSLTNKKSAQLAQDNGEPRPRLISTLQEFTQPAHQLLHEPGDEVCSVRYFESHAAMGGEKKLPHLLTGVAIPIGEARRPVAEEEIPDPKVVEGIRQRRHLLTFSEKMDPDGKLLSQLGTILAQTPEDFGAPAAFNLANLYARKGQWDLARESFLFMVDRYPAHPLSADAYRWLILHNTSSEVRRRYELGQFVSKSQTSFGTPNLNPKLEPVKGGEIKQTSLVESTQSGKMVYLSNLEETRRWNLGAFEMNKRLLNFGPLYATIPSVQFCLQSAKRKMGDFEKSQEWYTKFRNYVGKGPWHDAAASELWLHQRGQLPQRKVAMCRLTDHRPHLDGIFDDACWNGQKPIQLENAVGATQKENPTEVMFAFDQEFLYLAVQCKHPEGKKVPPVKARPRDAELEAFDRISLLLDMDRDYSTYYQMEIDQRGCVREDCWGDKGWNPKWFVAVNSNEKSWQIEAAIPLAELTSEKIVLNSAWACNLVRILPGRGVQGVSLPADVQPRPEGMCLLLFVNDPGKNQIPPMSKVP